MATKARAKSPFAAFLNAVLMAGGVAQSGGSGNVVPTSITGQTVEEGNNLVFTVNFNVSQDLRLASISFSGTAMGGDDYLPINYTPTNYVHGSGYVFGSVVSYANLLWLALSPDTYLVTPGMNAAIWKQIENPFDNGVQVLGSALIIPAGITSFHITIPTMFNYHFDGDLTLNLVIGGVTGVGVITQKAEVWTPIEGAAGRTINSYHFGLHPMRLISNCHTPTVPIDIDTVNYGFARSHNTACGVWWMHERTQGVYSWGAWTWPGASPGHDYNPDEWITYHGNRDIPVMFTFRCPPPWAVKGVEGSYVWAASTAFNRVEPSNITLMSGIYPTNNYGAYYIPVQTGVSGATIPDFTIKRHNLVTTGNSWAGGVLTLTASAGDVALITTGDPILLEGSVSGEFIATVIDATHFSVPLTTNPGTISSPAMRLCVRDGTVIWRAQPIPSDGNYVPAGNMPWKNANATAYLNALLDRYCKLSPVNPTGKIMIKWLEVANEPSYARRTVSNQLWMMWNGSVGDLVDAVYETKQIVLAWEAANSIPAGTIKVLPAGFTYDISTSAALEMITTYVNANGFVNTAITGASTCADGITWHRYNTNVFNVGNFIDGAVTKGKLGYKPVRDLLVSKGLPSTTPQIISEWGMLNGQSGGGWITHKYYFDLNQAGQEAVFLSQALFSALVGFSGICYYGMELKFSDTTLNYVSGTPINKTDSPNLYGPSVLSGAVAASNAYNNFKLHYGGKTVTNAWVSNTRRIKTLIDGVERIIDTPKGYYY